MVKLKTILDTRRAKPDGTYPMMFRITNQKQVNYISFGMAVKEHEWDEKSCLLKSNHPNAASINASISKRFYEIQKAILTVEDEAGFSFEGLKKLIDPKKEPPVKSMTFLEFSNKVMADFISVNRTGNALVYLTAVNRLIKYCENPQIKFSEINYSILDGFRHHLLKEGIKKNSIGNYFRSIRALFNKAIKAKLVGRDLYPFYEISIKTEKTAKRAITIDELKKVYNHPKKINSQEWHAANFFFLSFALRGISFTDMAYLTSKNIFKEQISYRRRKTQKLYNITLHPLALRILAYYKENPTGYLIPIFPSDTIEDSITAKKVTRQWIKATNKYLNRIAKNCGVNTNLTTYVSRHTWATTAKKLGYSNEIIAEALGHEYGNKITNIYLDDFDQGLIDVVNLNVISSVIYPNNNSIV